MSAHALATAIEEEARAFARSRMTGRQDADLEAKDAHCKRIAALVARLRKQIGIPESLTLTTGTRYIGDRRVVVAERRPSRRKRSGWAA